MPDLFCKITMYRFYFYALNIFDETAFISGDTFLHMSKEKTYHIRGMSFPVQRNLPFKGDMDQV